MSRLSITIRTPDARRTRRLGGSGVARAIRMVVGITLGVTVGIAAEGPVRNALGTAGDGVARAVAIGLPADFAPPSPDSFMVLLKGPSIAPIAGDWAWDLERCTGAAGSGPNADARAVACLMDAEPGLFCDGTYRRAFVARARPAILRAAEPHRHEAAAMLRPGLRALLRSGVVRPWDFRLWRQHGRLPRLIEAISAAEALPPRSC